MCTVTIHRGPDGLLVTMNRDESVLRGPESPLGLHGEGDSAWLGPSDAETGGTWIAVNPYGVTACLLNRYTEETTPVRSGPSRGGIVPALLRRGGPEHCLNWLFGEFDPTEYASFDLIVLDSDGAATASWDRRGSLRRGVLPAGWQAVTSSSWNREAVVNWRLDKFRAWAEEPTPRFEGEIPAFNLLHETGKEWWSPLVRRDRVETRSLTQVEVNRREGRVEVRYWPRPFRDLGCGERRRIPLSGALSRAG